MKNRFKKIWVVLTLILTLQSVFQFYDVGSYGAVTDDNYYYYEKSNYRSYSLQETSNQTQYAVMWSGAFTSQIVYAKDRVYNIGEFYTDRYYTLNSLYQLGIRTIYQVYEEGVSVIDIYSQVQGDERYCRYRFLKIIKNTPSKGNYIETIIARNGTYPDNGLSNGYWYVKKGIANNPPTITTNYTDNQNLPVGKSIEISGSFNDLDISQNVGVKYKIENTSGTVVVQDTVLQDFIKSNNETHSFNKVIDLSSLSLGNYKLKVWAEDSLGISSTIKTFNLNVMNEPISSLSITSKAQSLSLNLSSTAAQGDLVQNPYKIVLTENGSEIKNTGWISGNTSNGLSNYTVGGLKPNTKYMVKAYISSTSGVTSLLTKCVLFLIHLNLRHPSIATQVYT